MINSATFNPSMGKARSLYIHVPFCRHRCGYCNFSLVAGRDDLIERYISAIEKEIGWLEGKPVVSTVFLGGGTPSHLSPNQLRRLFAILEASFQFVEDIEISVECNPNDLNSEKAETFSECGVNRISLGVQSLNDSKLKLLERDHNASDVVDAVSYARTFTDNISFDLIFATPGEKLGEWEQELKSAIELSPTHLSTYELTIEKGTQFWNRRLHGSLAVPDEDLRADLYEATIQQVTASGFQHYEISSFAQPHHRCQHNLSYWNGGDYLAFGPGAARFVDRIRETNHRSTTTWLKKVEAGVSPVFERQEQTKHGIAVDRIVFGLRQIDGFCLTQFRSETESDAIELMGTAADLLLENSLIEIKDDICRLTQSGIMVYDSIATKILEISTGQNKIDCS